MPVHRYVNDQRYDNKGFRSILLSRISNCNKFLSSIPVDCGTCDSHHMGNCVVRVTQKMGALLNLSDSGRAENYDVDANDIQRYVPLAGLRIEQTCRHGALEQTQTLREACSLRSSSPESSDIICEEKFCITRQDLLDCLLASDDQYKVVAAIGEKSSAIHF